MGSLRFWWFPRFLFGALAVAGCGVEQGGVPTPFQGKGGTGGTPTTITCPAGELLDAECGAPPPCCVKGPTPPLQGPSWFQITAPGTPGSCPEPATPGLVGYSDMLPVAPHACAACSCSPAACTLPEGIHTNAAKCPGDGSIAIPFGPDPAAGWEGDCSDDGALPADLQCGGVPCVQSLSIPALSVAQCQPESGPSAPFPEPTWGRMARQCRLDPLPEGGCDGNQVCVPRPPEGFASCLYVQGEHPACPAEYPAHMVFYTGVNDGRGCGACQCAAPEGAECAAIVTAFSDSACGSLVVSVLVTAAEPTCQDVVSGTALGSAEAWMVTDVSGSCAQSGGAPFGEIAPADPLTLCCQGEPDSPG